MAKNTGGLSRQQRRALQRAQLAELDRQQKEAPPHQEAPEALQANFRLSDIVGIVLAILLAVASMNTESVAIFSLCWGAIFVVLTIVIFLHRERSIIFKMAMTTISLVGASIAVYLNYSGSVEKSLRVTEGILFHNNLPRPQTHCQIPSGALAVFFGSNVAWTTGPHFTLLRLHGREAIGLDARPDGMKISNILILDDRNQPIVTIANQMFKIASIAKGKMPTKSNIIVYDYNGREALNIDLINQNTLKISGRFSDGQGEPILINTKETIFPRHNIISQSCFGGAQAAIAVN